MLYRITTALLVCFVAGLAVAATNPAATYEVLTSPSRALEKHRKSAFDETSREYWANQYAQAIAGDSDAQYRVGRVLYAQHWTHRNTGLTANPVLGEELIRRAAEGGHALARFDVWRMDNGTPDRLVAQFRAARSGESQHPLHVLRAEALSIAISECDARLLDEVRQSWTGDVTPQTSSESVALAGAVYSDFDDLPATRKYRETCGS